LQIPGIPVPAGILDVGATVFWLPHLRFWLPCGYPTNMGYSKYLSGGDLQAQKMFHVEHFLGRLNLDW